MCVSISLMKSRAFHISAAEFSVTLDTSNEKRTHTNEANDANYDENSHNFFPFEIHMFAIVRANIECQ